MATLQEQRDASLEAAIHEAEKVLALRARNAKLEAVAQVARKAMELIDEQVRALKAIGLPLGPRPDWEDEMRAALHQGAIPGSRARRIVQLALGVAYVCLLAGGR